MSIAFTSVPSAKQSAYRPVIFEVTSNRYSSSPVAVAVTSVSSGTGTKARYAVASHSFLVGDVVDGSAFTGSAVDYNIRQTVTVVDTLWFETDADFVATSTGTITRVNENFKVLFETFVFDSDRVIAFSMVYGGLVNGQHTILVSTWTDHNLVVGDVVFHEDSTEYDGVFEVVSVPTATSYHVVIAWTSDRIGVLRKGTYLGKKWQQPITSSGTDIFRFDTANFLRASLSYDLHNNYSAAQLTNVVTPTENSIKWYGVRVTEHFDDADGLLKEGDSSVHGTYQVCNIALQHSDSGSLTTRILGNDARLFLTNAPRTKYIREGEEEQLSFLMPSDQTVTVKWRGYNLDGIAQPIQTLTAVSVIDQRGIIPINSQMIDPSLYSKVVVWLTLSGGIQISEMRTYIIDTKCYMDPVRFYFMNPWGGFDAFTFTGSYKEMTSVRRQTYIKSLPITHAIADRGENITGVAALRRYEVYSRMLSKAEITWLAELVESPMVFIKEPAIGAAKPFIPVILNNSNDPLYDSDVPGRLRIVYTLANDRVIQRN